MLVLVNLKNFTDINSILSNCLENSKQYVLQTSCAYPGFSDRRTNISIDLLFFNRKYVSSFRESRSGKIGSILDTIGILLTFTAVFLVFIIRYNKHLS